MDAYGKAALRWLRDGDCLLHDNRYGGASHAYGLAAECALKHVLASLLHASEIPRRHLPDLREDVRRSVKGRKYRGLYQLLGMADYMEGWVIDNRYWADDAFDDGTTLRYRDHARRTCAATTLGV